MPVSDTSLHDCGGFHQPGARSVSWNSTGNWLAMGGPSPRIWSIDLGSNTNSNSNNGGGSSSTNNTSSSNNATNVGRCSEVLVISGHSAPVDRVRFHPTEASCLCTSALDGTVRIWDIRAGTERSVGKVDVQSGKSATYVDFAAGSSTGGSTSSSNLAITERDGSVHVFDSRKLSSGASSNTGRGGRSNNNNSKSTPLSTFRIPGADMDACIFSPSGKHLVAATNKKGVMMSDLRIWSWKEGSDAFDASIQKNTQYTVPAHTGPIFTMAFSPDGKRLATGSSDSIVGIWDVATMCCAVSITKRLKLIRSVAFSNDSRWLAHANEEDGIDICNANSGDQVGSVQLRENPTMGAYGGADEIAFNPTTGNVLACARAPIGHMAASTQSAAVVIKCRISN